MITQRTLELLMQAMRRHLDDAVVRRILKDLTYIPGDKSFRDTVETLWILSQKPRRAPPRV